MVKVRINWAQENSWILKFFYPLNFRVENGFDPYWRRESSVLCSDHSQKINQIIETPGVHETNLALMG